MKKNKKLIRGRKATNTFTLAMVVIIGIAALIVIGSLLKTLSDRSEELANEKRCRDSVLAYAKLNRLPGMDASAEDIDCPVKFEVIEKQSSVKSRRQVADMMYNCWRNYGAGELDLFSAIDDKFCAVCSIFEFEDKSTKLDSMTTFLLSEKVPDRNKEGVRPTYFEYLQGKQISAEALEKMKQSDVNYIDGGKRYAVLFTFYDESYWHVIQQAIYGAGKGGLTGALLVIGVSAGLGIAGATFGMATPVSVLIITASTAAGAVFGAETAVPVSATGENINWDANIVLVEYSPESMQTLGCDAIPVSLIDREFR